MKIVSLVGMAIVTIAVIPITSFASTMRAYCKPNEVVLERRADQNFTEENKLFPVTTLIVDEAQIPAGNPDQLRCRNGTLVADENVKTPALVRQEAIRNLKQKLDELLAEDEPDVVEVLRLQRKIEKARSG